MQPFSGFAALVLAAGKGTRMRSPKPKVLHSLLGSPMLAYVLQACQGVFQDEKILVVSGHKKELLEAAFPAANFIWQREQLGTGHALACAMPEIGKIAPERVFIINGDAPLATSAEIIAFLEKSSGADIAFATITLPDPGPYGRVARKDSKLIGIIEAKDYDIALHGEPGGEVNAGMYCLKLDAAKKLLPQLKNSNKSGEYYLTDLIGLGIAAGMDVRGVSCGEDENLLGVNSPAELAAAENLLAARVANELLAKGVIIHAPQLLRASPLARIEPGAEISCPCDIYGACEIAAGAEIGPYCVIINSVIHADAKIRPFSHLEGAEVGPEAQAGPYTRLRPGAKMEEGAHAGNFVELKKATLGKGAKANHLSYLGDATIGANANIGAGTITCNYDGKSKHQTSIGENAFIGSNSALVAPVSIGDNALVGAGSVITKDAPENSLAIGRAKQQNLPRRKK